MRTAIRVQGLGKQYRIGAGERSAETFREMLVSAALAPFCRLRRLAGHVSAEQQIWALKDVSFEVKEGEVVGIIGRNGAGKSTLLKILSRITEPTKGRAEIHGRVSSLLEVGTGFHSELTGRENVYLNGAILGMGRTEINSKFDEIVDFAGIEKFLDTPVKRYSSGMYVRLAFAVAAHLDPEILIIDEVLAVGDAAFQKKCLGKMRTASASGRTVLFVSHNLGAVRSLCTRGMVLREGIVCFDGSVENAITKYLSAGEADIGNATEWSWPTHAAPGGNGNILVKRVRVLGEEPNRGVFSPHERVTVIIEYEQTKRLSGMRFVLYLLTASGETAFATTDYGVRAGKAFSPGHYEACCFIPGYLLNRTTYLIRISAGIPRQQVLLEQIDVGRLRVDGAGNEGMPFRDDHWPGAVCPKLVWEVRRLESRVSSSHKTKRSF